MPQTCGTWSIAVASDIAALVGAMALFGLMVFFAHRAEHTKPIFDAPVQTCELRKPQVIDGREWPAGWSLPCPLVHMEQDV